MKILRNEKGVALVMVTIIALIGLAIVSALLYMVIQGTQISGAQKFYRSAEEAGYGGADISVQFVRDNIFNASQGLAMTYITALERWTWAGSMDSCLQQKLSVTRGADWSASNWDQCTDANRVTNLDPTVEPDFRFEVEGTSRFMIYSKVVDTVKGNTEESSIAASGAKLGGAPVVKQTGGEISPPPNPSLYRIEVQSQDENNPRERARFSVLYAF
jgi:hypothetical protein